MDTDKYLKNYLIENGDYKTVKKTLIKKILLAILIGFVILIYFKPITYMREKIDYNYSNYKKERKKHKIDGSRIFTNFNLAEPVGVITNPTYNGKYPVPIEGKITSNYGYRQDPFNGKSSFHTGVDIQGKHHDNVIAIEKGEVIFSGVQNGYGNCILLRHKEAGFYTFYAHLSQRNVTKGEVVKQGTVIGLEGGAKTDPNHGYSTGHHLHFEVRQTENMSSHVNPNNYIF